jgi:hypothetical protein
MSFRPRVLSQVAAISILMLILPACTTAPQPAVWSPNDTSGAFPQATNAGVEAGAGLPTPLVQQEQMSTPTDLPLEALPELPADVDPLTGLNVVDPTRLERRPVMVKVSNYPRAGRPHSGLSYADLVFEYYIGLGYNRFLAVFLGQDAQFAGPVRSGRYVDAQLAEMYQALIFFANADERVEKVLSDELGARALAEKNIPSPPKYRLEGDIPETTLFVNTRELSDYYTANELGANARRDLRGMVFSPEIHPVNEAATFLGVQFSRQARGEWRYDPDSGTYKRWIETGPGETGGPIPMTEMVDHLNNRQIAFQNVVILFATYTEYNPSLHNIALFDQNAGKRAVFFRDGVRIEGTWKNIGNAHPIQFFNSWGLPMQLKPGNTWIVLTGDLSTLQSPAPGQWELRFDLP